MIEIEWILDGNSTLELRLTEDTVAQSVALEALITEAQRWCNQPRREAVLRCSNYVIARIYSTHARRYYPLVEVALLIRTPLPQLTSYEPAWNALLAIIGEDGMDDWMYMGSAKDLTTPWVHTYKHRDTRRSINLSDDGQFWQRETRDYRKVSQLHAFAHCGIDSPDIGRYQLVSHVVKAAFHHDQVVALANEFVTNNLTLPEFQAKILELDVPILWGELGF